MQRKFYGEEYSYFKAKDNNEYNIKTLGDLYNILKEAWCKESAYPSCQKDWIKADATYGQCAVTAMIVNDIFGGTIHKIRVDGGGTHYFNKVQGKYIDLTIEQFDLYDIAVSYEPNMEVDRKYCGTNADTILRDRVLKEGRVKIKDE